MCLYGRTEVEIGCDWALISPQCFKIRVRNILDITSYICFLWMIQIICNNIQFFVDYIGVWITNHQPEVFNWCFGISNRKFMSLSMISTSRWIVDKSPLIFTDIFNTDICCFILRVFSNRFIWNCIQLNIIFLMIWLDSIK